MPLANGVKPIAGVLTLLFSANLLNDVALGLSQVKAGQSPGN